MNCLWYCFHFSLAGPMWHCWLLLLSHTSLCRPCLKDLFGECNCILHAYFTEKVVPDLWDWFLLFVYVLLLLVVWYQMLHRNCVSFKIRPHMFQSTLPWPNVWSTDSWKNKIDIFWNENYKVMILSFWYLGRFFLPVSMVICNDIFAYIFGMFIFCFIFKNALFVHINLLQ